MAGGETPAQSKQLPSHLVSLYDQCRDRIDRALVVDELLRVTTDLVYTLLNREDEIGVRDQTLGQVSEFYARAPSLESMRDFAHRVFQMIVSLRHRQAYTYVRRAPRLHDAVDIPVELRPMAPTDVHIIAPPAPRQCPTFQALLSGAVQYRLGTVTTFFHRFNPQVERKLKRPFFLSPVFAEHFAEIVDETIVPLMMTSRSMGVISTIKNWNEIDTAGFWDTLHEVKKVEPCLTTWRSAWELMGRKATSRPEVLSLRHKLARRMSDLSKDDRYDLPELGDGTLPLLSSFLTDYDRDTLEDAWTRVRQIYEQEMDRRIYQDKARSGALRDALLDCFETFPDRFGEALVLLCYFTFPKISLAFLENFTRNKAPTLKERRQRVPLLMQFIEQPAAGSVSEEEAREEVEYQHMLADFRVKLREAEKNYLPPGAMGWR